jgi:hypothetical protein
MAWAAGCGVGVDAAAYLAPSVTHNRPTAARRLFPGRSSRSSPSSTAACSWLLPRRLGTYGWQHGALLLSSSLSSSSLTDEEDGDPWNRIDDAAPRQPSKQDYQLAHDAGPMLATCPLTEAQIHAVMAQRRAAQRARDFDAADVLLQRLGQAGVAVQDKRREWRADGQTHFGRTSVRRHRPYVRRGGTHGMTESVVEEMANLVEARAQAKRARDYLLADKLSDQLKTHYGVQLKDKAREWSLRFVDCNDDDETLVSVYVPSPIVPADDPTHTMDGSTQATIQARCTERYFAQRQKDYARADFIRDKLAEKYAVVLDDRTREWTIGSSSGSHTQDNARFAQGATASQRSAFVRTEGPLREEEGGSLLEQDDDDVEAALAAILDDRRPGPAALRTVAAETPVVPPTVAETPAASSQESLQSLTIPLLKEKLRDAGLPVSGTKAVLMARLLQQ